MSQSIRRMFVAMSVATALLVAVPASSWAAQTRKPAPEEHTFGLMARAWSWLESLLGDTRPRAGVQSKDIMTTPPTTAPLPPANQGPAIDPNGAK